MAISFCCRQVPQLPKTVTSSKLCFACRSSRRSSFAMSDVSKNHDVMDAAYNYNPIL